MLSVCHTVPLLAQFPDIGDKVRRHYSPGFQGAQRGALIPGRYAGCSYQVGDRSAQLFPAAVMTNEGLVSASRISRLSWESCKAVAARFASVISISGIWMSRP